MFKNVRLRTKIIAGSCMPLLLIIGLSVMSSQSIKSLLKSNDMVNHTHEVIAEANSIVAAAVDMETGARGYLLAGHDEFLEPYSNGDKAFRSMVSELKEIVADNPPQVELLNEIEATINEWQKNAVEPAIEMRAEIGDAQTMNDMAHLIAQAKGKQYFDQFRAHIATFVGKEEVLMKQREEQAVQAEADRNAAQTKIAETSGWVTHTRNVIAQAYEIVAAAVDMETGVRGFLLAGEDGFLDPYRAGGAAFDTRMAELQETVNDNPAQVAILRDAQKTIEDWQTNVTEPNIELRKSVASGAETGAATMDQVAAVVAKAEGKQYFDKFRGNIATFISREEALMRWSG